MARNRRLIESRIHYPSGSQQNLVRQRLLYAGLALVAVMGVGTLGYKLIGEDHWSLMDCAYMVLITITSVGYGEVIPVSEIPGGRLFTMALLIAGMGVSFYFLSSLTAFIIEGDLQRAIWRRRMRRNLAKFKNHYIVCGAGQTGGHVVEELLEAGHQVVVIELTGDRLDHLARAFGTRFVGIEGDATEDEVLLDAGIENAAGIVTALHSDRDNLFITVTARQMVPSLRIVSRAVHDGAHSKLLRAGADAIVSPNDIGGRRMAHELLRPNVVGFLDLLVRDSNQKLNLEQCTLPPGTVIDGVTLADSGIRQVSNVLVLSVLDADGVTYTFNPPSSFILKAGMTVIVLGGSGDLERLRSYLV